MIIKYKLIILSITIIGISACKKDVDVAKNSNNSASEISGVVQKGPFSVGSTITMQELLPSLNPTGRVFESEIEDNRGTFHVPAIFLTSSIVALRADGFYFNEISGTQSAAQITLNCLSDIKNKNTININLLSHLEKPRIEYLISQGTSFTNAKKQAEQEVLKIFSISKPTIAVSELLDITHNGDDNAILLAASLILQGYRTEGELSNLLASISYDLRPDGVLSDSTLGSALINDAKYLRMDSIRQNIKARWNVLGITDTIPNFEKYIKLFMDSTKYRFTNFIKYPSSGIYGVNILNKTDSIFIWYTQVSMSAFLPKGSSLKIAAKNVLGLGPMDGWNALFEGDYAFFVSNKSGTVEMRTSVGDNTQIKIYENGATSPTRVKNLYKK